MLGKAATLLEVCAGAEARVDGAGEDEGASRAKLGELAEGEAGVLLAVGAVLVADVVDLCAQGGEEIAGDGVAGGGAVELEDADVAGAGGGEVGDGDEGAGGLGGVETADEGGGGCARSCRRGEESGRHGGRSIGGVGDGGLGKVKMESWRC